MIMQVKGPGCLECPRTNQTNRNSSARAILSIKALMDQGCRLEAKAGSCTSQPERFNSIKIKTVVALPGNCRGEAGLDCC